MLNRPQRARLAGLLYIFIVITGYFSIMYIPARFIVLGNATETAARIAQSEMLFRVGIANGLISSVLFFLLGLALYQLFKEVHQGYARLMVMLVLMQVPLAVVDATNQLAALMCIKGPDFMHVFDEPQRNALALMFLRAVSI